MCLHSNKLEFQYPFILAIYILFSLCPPPPPHPTPKKIAAVTSARGLAGMSVVDPDPTVVGNPERALSRSACRAETWSQDVMGTASAKSKSRFSFIIAHVAKMIDRSIITY